MLVLEFAKCFLQDRALSVDSSEKRAVTPDLRGWLGRHEPALFPQKLQSVLICIRVVPEW